MKHVLVSIGTLIGLNGVLDEYIKLKAYQIWDGKQPLYGGTSLMKSLQ